MKLNSLVIIGIVFMSSAGTASAQNLWNMLGPVRNPLGSQLRHASPVAYQVLLGANRTIPPQVRNGGGFGYGVPFGGPAYGFSPYGIAYQQELAAIRSIPPQVKNEWAKQARLASINAMQPQPVYRPNPSPAVSLSVTPTVIAPAVHNGGVIITAPPPSMVIPNGR